VRSCHERWDGAGYPDGLAGEEIPLIARVVSSCDALNAMTTDRPYRSALPLSQALDEIERNSGGQFDPTVVAALVRVVGRQTGNEGADARRRPSVG
jgi:two-component system, cell cycle response regulator